MRRSTFSEPGFYVATASTTLLMEVATVLARVFADRSAAEFNEAVDPPLLVKMHHMFWAVPFVLAAFVVSGKRSSYFLWALAIGLIASDLAHHFVVLPLWVGNTGWHWP